MRVLAEYTIDMTVSWNYVPSVLVRVELVDQRLIRHLGAFGKITLVFRAVNERDWKIQSIQVRNVNVLSFRTYDLVGADHLGQVFKSLYVGNSEHLPQTVVIGFFIQII